MQIRLANPNLQIDSIVDGEGIRAVLWTQGCGHNCYGCHNPSTHSFNDGYLIDIDDIKKQLDNLENHDGITLSGGDPLYQLDPILEIIQYCHKLNLNVWCYTGYTFEELIKIANNNSKMLDVLNNIDVLVDGPFILKEKSYDAIFRGSKNQRIIDVAKSLEQKEIVLVKRYYTQKSEEKKSKKIYV